MTWLLFILAGGITAAARRFALLGRLRRATAQRTGNQKGQQAGEDGGDA
jgi:hypothetical protein